ncbi:hypothetical protein V8F06_006975 [Rhypophila decipiens]
MKSLLSSRRKPLPATPVLPSSANNDLFSCLPTELVLLIFNHLTTPLDILSALNVCHTWRSILLSPEIWTPLADLLFPGLAPHIRASFPGTEAVSIHAQGDAFHRTLHSHYLFATGHFSNAKHYAVRLDHNTVKTNTLKSRSAGNAFTLSKAVPVSAGGVHDLELGVPDLDLDPAAEDEHVSRIKLYSRGRVAWWPEGWHLPFFAVIDDLRMRSRKMYLFPGQAESGRDRKCGWKTALGGLLFIMGQEEVGFCVWHLERDEMKMVHLPGAINRCVVHGERLLFVGRRNAEVWLWDWESARVEAVDVAGMGCYAPGLLRMGGQILLGYPSHPRPPPMVGLRFQDTDVKVDFILHPTKQNAFFVLKWDEVDLVMFEITGGELTARVLCPREHLAYRIMRLSRTQNTVHYLRSERCDAYGGYCIMTAWIGNEPTHDPNPICAGPCGSEGSLGSVCFNVYTKTFSAFLHCASYHRTPDTHLWDGLLAVGVTGVERDNSKRSTKLAVVLLKPCDGGRRATTQTSGPGFSFSVRKMTPPPSRTAPAEVALTLVPLDHTDIRPRAEFLQRVAYALDAGGDALPTGFDQLKTEWLNGDENTLIYVAGKEYTVWTFGEDWYPKTEKREVRTWRHGLRSVLGIRAKNGVDVVL